jgi:hypothetical protein
VAARDDEEGLEDGDLGGRVNGGYGQQLVATC